MTKLIETTVLKPHMAPNGVIVQVGDTIHVDEHRHRQLVKKGYVPRPDGETAPVAAPREVGVITSRDFEKSRTKITGDGGRADRKPKEKAAPAASE